MYGVIFLLVLAFIWIVFATVQDLRKREIANWLSFSLIIFALGFRFFYGLFSETGFNFFYQGLIGLGIFFVIGNLLYYGKMFAGGDAKLMIALGAVLPFSEIFSTNLKIFILFFLIFLFAGAFYSLIVTMVLSLKNFRKFRKEFNAQLKKNKKIIYPVMFFGLVLMALGFVKSLLFAFGVFVFILPYFYVYIKSVDESCMIKKVKTFNLEEGDWLYKNVRVGKKLIIANWNGLDRKDIRLIKKRYKAILIRQGIPFTPVFLISFLILLYIWFSGLWQNFGFV